MPTAAHRIRLLALASAASLAPSCGEKPRPQVALNPPADLLARRDEPPMSLESLNSEAAYERDRQAKIEWGRQNAGVIDRACQWLKDAGVAISCRPQGD